MFPSTALTDQRAPLGDMTVSYTVAGDGPPVVFVHGLAEDRSSWAYLQQRLSGWRTIAYDVRGHGGSTIGDAQGSADQLAADLVRVLENVTGPAACVGFSLGGTVVLLAAARRPELVSHAIVLGTSSVVGRAAVAYYQQRIGIVEGGDPAAVEAALVDDTAAALVGDHDVAVIARWRRAAIGTGDGYRNAARAMAGLRERSLTTELAGIRCPVDVLGADQDAFCPRKAADILLEGLPAGRYHEVASAGHLMIIDQPETVTDLVSRLLNAAYRDRP